MKTIEEKSLNSQWISVEDELPEESMEIFDTGISKNTMREVLAYLDYGKGLHDFTLASRKKFESTDWMWWDVVDDCEIKNVSYWMPIPRLPQLI